MNLVVGVLLLGGAGAVQATAQSAAQCNGQPATIEGTAAGEVLRGTSGPNRIAAGAGNDIVRAYAGRDVVAVTPAETVSLAAGPGIFSTVAPTRMDSMGGTATTDCTEGLSMATALSTMVNRILWSREPGTTTAGLIPTTAPTTAT